MGSTTRRRGVYGREYASIGLRLLAWWKKNGERRLQKAGSGFAQIRLSQNLWLSTLFYKRHTRLGVGARSNTRTLCALARSACNTEPPDQIDPIDHQRACPCRLPCSCRHGRCSPKAQGLAGPARTRRCGPATRPAWPFASERARSAPGRLARSSEPGRSLAAARSPFFLFISSK
jgi:hypothetical protein